MYKLLSRYVLALLSCLSFVSGVRGQYVWNVSIPTGQDANDNGDKYYEFDAVDCSGDNCTASGLYVDDSAIQTNPPVVRIEIFRSLDGGNSWTMQDPGLPLQDGQGENGIYRIQQIDSLNIVGTGDSGLVIHTFDGGKTWERQDLPFPSKYAGNLNFITDIHFSDAATGIVVTDKPFEVFTTTDSGRQWEPVKLPRSCVAPWSCHSYGGGMFRVMSYDYGGLLFTTRDNWKTYDSSYVTQKPDSTVLLSACGFGRGDTMLACGYTYDTMSSPLLFMSRSVDGGLHWSKISIAGDILTDPRAVSSLDANFIMVVGGSEQQNTVILSTNGGETWQNDTIPPDSLRNNNDFILSLAVPDSGHAIMVPYGGPLSVLRSASVDIVNSIATVANGICVFPNPATETVNITPSAGPFTVVDPLGRSYDVRQTLSALDISSLPSGVYFVSDGLSRAKFVKK